MLKANHLVYKKTTKATLPMPESPRERRQAGRKLTSEALLEMGASLTDIDWRLLHWLLHYPLQRADDLVVGVARWASRATVYRHVSLLETSGLIESVLPKTPGTGKWLYHLSNPGLYLLAWHLDKPVRELARRWQADEAGLLRLLPRLPTLLLLQDVINGLVTHAAEAMTTQGRRPQLVRWNWQRDLTHCYQYREQKMRFFADGILALCIRTQQGESRVLDQWYGVVFLFTELDDERFMRLRLERLLCWRESPERWSCYQHMLPVLILARSQRQRDHWQRAVETTALKLRLEPSVGALVSLPLPESIQVNPWVLNWRTLATEMPCHLQDVLKPLPYVAVPSSVRLEDGEDENRSPRSPSNVSTDAASTGIPPRVGQHVKGDLANRVAHVAQGEREEQEVVALLGLRLNPCQWNILHVLLAHPLLSDEELAAFVGIQRRSVRCSLYELHQLGCLEPVVTSVGKRWHFCERGLRLIAAANHMHIRNISVVPDDEIGRVTSPMLQRGEAWLLQHIQHTAGIYGFFARLARAARKELEQVLCWWETGVVCERRYRVGEQWCNLRPDALAEYRIGSQPFRFWLEWDRGTMNVRDLVTKFISYVQYIDSREWAKDWSTVPLLICVAPDIAQEKRMQRVALTKLACIPNIVFWTTTEEVFNELGPLAPIWSRGILTRVQGVQQSYSLRQRVFDVVPETEIR
jgi:predicted transcriptional regulator